MVDRKDMKKVESNFWTPEKEGDILKGTVLSVDEGAYGMTHTIETEEKEVFLTPSNKVLQNRLEKVKVGFHVEIEYIGEEPPKVKGHNPTQMFDVYYLEPANKE